MALVLCEPPDDTQRAPAADSDDAAADAACAWIARAVRFERMFDAWRAACRPDADAE